MSLQEIKDKAETWIQAFKDQILSPQEDYFDSNGVCWIGVSTPAPMPSDGATNGKMNRGYKPDPLRDLWKEHFWNTASWEYLF